MLSTLQQLFEFGPLFVSNNASELWPIGASPDLSAISEEDRLVVLASFDLESLDGDQELGRIARFAAKICNCPSAAISIVGREHQRLLVRQGVEGGKIARQGSFCAEAMLASEPLEVLNAVADPRFRQFEKVVGPDQVRYYVGAPLISSEGAPIGALCLFDDTPREEGLDAVQMEGLLVLAEAVKRRLEAHRISHRATAELEDNARQMRFMLDSVPDIAWEADAGPVFRHFNARWEEITGLPAPEQVDDWQKVIHPDDWAASLEKFENAVRTATDFEDQWRMRQSGGTYRWVLSRAVPTTQDPATARWFGTLTDIDDHVHHAEQRELLSQELSHRIKNIFAVVSGLVAIRAREKSDDIKDFTSEISDLIASLSAANEYVHPIGRNEGDTVAGLSQAILTPYMDQPSARIEIEAPDLPLAAKSATPLALILHELATNAAKYGALSGHDGIVKLTFEETASKAGQRPQILMRWQEQCSPAPREDTQARELPSDGFGSTLLRMSVTSQLRGTFERNFTNDGLDISISIPREKLISE